MAGSVYWAPLRFHAVMLPLHSQTQFFDQKRYPPILFFYTTGDQIQLNDLVKQSRDFLLLVEERFEASPVRRARRRQPRQERLTAECNIELKRQTFDPLQQPQYLKSCFL